RTAASSAVSTRRTASGRMAPTLKGWSAGPETGLADRPYASWVQTVAVLSLKGGVGKTTVVLGLASAALRRGARTLVVDLDPQCNATATLDPQDTEATIAEVLETPRPTVLRQAIAHSGWSDEVDVLVGSEELESLN